MQQPIARTQPEGVQPRKSLFGRCMRGCMMLVGILTTAYALVRLVIWLLVKAPEWMPWLQLIS